MDVQVDGIETHTHTASPTQTVYIQTACHQLMANLDKPVTKMSSDIFDKELDMNIYSYLY